jgi:hypothetical protein
VDMADNKITLKDFTDTVSHDTLQDTNVHVTTCNVSLKVIKNSASSVSLVFDMDADVFITRANDTKSIRTVDLKALVKSKYESDVPTSAFYNNLANSLNSKAATVVELDLSRLAWKKDEEVKSIFYTFKIVTT